MQIDGETLILEADMTPEDIIEVRQFIAANLRYIEALEVDAPIENWNSSALLALLVSAKKSKPSIKVPLLEGRELISPIFGTMNWICYE